MRILLLSPTNPSLGPHNKLAPWQPQKFWVKALKNLGHDVSVFIYTKPVIYQRTKLDRKFSNISPEVFLTNKKLLNFHQQTKPDMVIISAGTWMIKPKTIKLIAKTSKVFIFSGVSPITFNSSIEQTYLLFTQAVVTNDTLHARQWLSLGAANVQTLPISAIDPQSVLSVKPNNKFKSDISIVATLFENRQNELENIIKLLPPEIDFKIWGELPGVSLRKSLQKHYQGEAWGSEVISIYKSARIGLNIAPDHMETSGNIRTFEIAASGALQIASKPTPGWFINNKEIIVYNSNTQLINKINYYLKHEKEAKIIALNGKKRAFKEHTYEKHFALFFKTQFPR